MKYISVALLGLFLCSMSVFGQSGSKWVFDDTTLPEIRITLPPDSLPVLIEKGTQRDDFEFLASFSITKNGETETVDSVGFRLRGNTSRDSQKKSFKVSFNTFIQGREYRGLDKMNINGEHNDPSIMRAKVSWDIFEKMSVKSSRANHVAFYINDVFYGLYLNVEHIDDEMIKKEFDDDSGNLYKCLYPSDLTYSEDEDYSSCDLKTNKEINDYSDLAAFAEFLETASPQDYEEQIHEYLDVDATLKWMAIDALTGNWDNYSFNKNNFYLYHSPEEGRFSVIPYDYDNTLGIDFFGVDWTDRDLYSWGNQNEERPLTNRLLEVQKFKDWYSYYINKTIEEIFNVDSLFPEIDRLKAQVQTSAEADTFRTKDWGFYGATFDNSFTEAFGGHVKNGLKPFIEERKASALNQLHLNNIYPIILSSSSKLLDDNGDKSIVVEAKVIDDDLDVVVAKLDIFSILDPFQLKDDGQGFDLVANDGVYTGVQNINSYSEDVNFFVNAQDEDGKVSRYPQNPSKKITQENSTSVQTLVINELMASNSNTIQDESGSYPDWVEIFNVTNSPISMSGYFLTDDLNENNKWAFPDTTIEAEGFLLVWADDDEKEGPMHASFNLSKDGEDLGLFKQTGENFNMVNSITFGPQTTDVSYARDGDGNGNFVFREEPTPGSRNGLILSSEEGKEIPKEVTLKQNYPNPFNPSTTITFSLNKQEQVTLEVFNMTGQLVETITNKLYSSGSHSVILRAEHLSSGVYFYRLKTATLLLTKKLTLIK